MVIILRMVGMELNELQKSSSLHEDNESIYSRLCEPILLISNKFLYLGYVEDLATLEAIQEILDAIMFKTSLASKCFETSSNTTSFN
ncbi:hypothetical protein CEXT_261451 [Caerostris extrusa]|uniref:Uncharacterized protein n=1 Tax=Caerostris extrusa TaxID=172846 RepID=A0AAV4PSP2_CAEEX|nr:hypothetical protein CEXT_261451 [Caerostris extrusa]